MGSIPDAYKTDNLMLLVGTNPLPNYVAAQLLSRESTRLHLVVSKEIQQADIHRRLIKLLRSDPFDETQYVPVESADPWDVFSKVQDRIKNTPGSWGLHYTGGKKSMATHAYRAMERCLAEKKQQGVYSYLDADSLELVIEAPDQLVREYVHLEIPICIENILDLHGREVRNLHETPFQPEFTEAVITFCQVTEQRQQCLQWAQSTLRREDGKPLNETLARQVEIPFVWPIIGGKTLEILAQEWGQKAAFLADWLHGKWLEDYVLAQAKRAAASANVHQVVSSLQPRGIVDFEVDVVAMQGYRLFAISATTEDEKGRAKLKLFEAMIRARQMGGDEAKVALVTFSEKPEYIEREVGEKLTLIDSEANRGWKSPVRVFGIRDLPKLAAHLESWFKEV